jgi:hypothetical protein
MIRPLAGTFKEQPPMNVMTNRSLAAALTTALAAVPMIGFGADTSHLDVRMGLWETTTTVQGAEALQQAAMAGMPAEAREGMAQAMQNMTPERRAQMAAAMGQVSQRHAGLQVHKARSCITVEKLQKEGFFNDKEMQEHCTHTVTQNDGRATAVSFSCTEDGVTSKGQVRFEATSPTSVKGAMDMHMVIHDRPVTTHSDFQSTWISADCGTEK